jgi:hypothetical protein
VPRHAGVKLGTVAEQLFGYDGAEPDPRSSVPLLRLLRIHTEIMGNEDTRMVLSDDQQRFFRILWQRWTLYKASYRVSPDDPTLIGQDIWRKNSTRSSSPK